MTVPRDAYIHLLSRGQLDAGVRIGDVWGASDKEGSFAHVRRAASSRALA